LLLTEKRPLYRMVSVCSSCCSSESCAGRRLHGVPGTNTLATGS